VAPTLTCPTDISTQSPDGLPVNVSFQMPAAQGGSPPVPVTCSVPATNAFPIGTTPVTCTATDALSRSASCSFTVEVRPPPELRFTRFVAFGDSLTAGEVSPAPSLLFLSPTDAYPFRLEGMLRARYPRQTITVENHGVPGELATEGGGARLPSVLTARRPEVVLIMEGTNDLHTRTPDRIVDALNGMIRDASQRQVMVFLATVPPQRPGGRRDAVARIVPVLNDLIRALAAREKVPLVDVYAPLAADLSLIGRDDLHPTELGYQVMARTFFDAIVARLDTSVTPPAFGR